MNPPPVRNDRGHTFDLVMFDEAIDELLEKAPDVPMAAIATIATGKILHWNKFAELLYGWTADEVLGKNIADITVGPVQSEMASAVMESLAAGKAWTGGFTSRCKDGSYLDVIVLDAPVIDRDKQFVGIIGFSREDPEQFKAALDEVRSLRELGEHVDRVRNEVLRDLAARFHDELSLSMHRMVERRAMLLNHPDMTESLLEEVKAFAAIQGDIETTMQGIWRSLRPPLLDEFGVAASIEYVARTLADQGVESVDVDVDTSVDRLSITQQELLLMLIQEAVANVASHAQAQACSVSVTLDGDVISIDVTDNGRGYEGRVGFGIRLMQERVKRSGGTMQIEPGSQDGTSILISLPALW